MYKEVKLGYLKEEVDPFISTHAIGIHYSKHYIKYLDKLNSLLYKNNFNFNIKLEDVHKNISSYSSKDKEDILFNLGGVLNHNLFFKSIGIKSLPIGKLLDTIVNKYGSFDNFYKVFKENSLSIKGSGYTFLVLNNNSIDIINTSNQESPLFYGMIPLFTIDLWEHSYYLDYFNNRELYLDNIYNIVNFDYASKVYEENIKNNKLTS